MTQQVNPDTLQKFETFYQDRVTDDDVSEGYENWALRYDKDFDAIVHRGHIIVGDVMEELYMAEDRGSVSILDVAAGTGRVGQELKERGFENLEALDACAPMLEAARKKDVYRKLILSRVGEDPLDIPEGSYDAISCSAAFVEGHLPAKAIYEFVRLVKPGGLVVMVGNATYWNTIPEYCGKMAAVIAGLENQRAVSTVKREVRDGYIGDKYAAIIIVLRKL